MGPYGIINKSINVVDLLILETVTGVNLGPTAVSCVSSSRKRNSAECTLSKIDHIDLDNPHVFSSDGVHQN